MTPTTYGRDFAYCLKSHGGVRGFNASLWRFLLRCTLFCHSVATFLTSVSSYEGGCGFEVTLSQTVKNMSMKRIFFMFLALLLCVMVQAQDNVEITLNNGNVVKGVTKTLFMLDDGDVVVTKDSNSKEKKEYKSTEIKSIKYYDSKSKKWIKFVPLMAQKSLPSVWNKNPKPYKTPIFLKPVYEGENVSAYIHYISTITNTKTLHLEGTNYVFYFKVKNEDVAKGYCMGSSIGAKMLLKIVFKPYPVMKETVSNLDTKEFYKDPISLIRTFDSLLK